MDNINLIKTALSRGGDYADIYYEKSSSNELSLRDGEVNSVSSSIDAGVGIRVLSGDKTGYAYSESTLYPDMDEAARAAALIASLSTSTYTPTPFKVLSAKNYYPITKDWSTESLSSKKSYIQRLNEKIYKADSKVIKATIRLSDSDTEVSFFNSLGESFSDHRPMASLNVTCVMSKGERIENFSVSRSFRKGAEFLTEEMIDEVVAEIISGCNRLFEASQPRGGVMSVVMGAGGSGILLHEAIGHSFEADFNRKQTSIFSDKMGQKICNEKINIVDDGTLLYNRGSINFDDEGTPSQKTYMVKDGVLNSYLHDRISAAYYKVPPTGNGRRESFRYNPIPRMRATYMENGDCKESDLIKEVKRGIYVDSFSNGQVQIGAGDFTFYVKSGYMIENGKLTTPIKDFNIIGNGPEALADIMLVADNGRMENGTWTCGKEQYCPVSCGMPSVLVRKLIVGGSSDE